MKKATEETKEFGERAKIALLESEPNAGLFMMWFLVFGETKEYAEKVLNTELAD